MNEENMVLSLILDSDSYKMSHVKQYPPNTTYMMSYFESRGGRWSHTLFQGLQYNLKKFLSKRITMEMVDEANEFTKLHGTPFNYEGWKRIATDLNGKLPIRIKAVPEGTVVPISNVLMTIDSTDPETFWIVSYLETMLVRLWYPTTVATNSYFVKQDIKRFLELTSDNPEAELPFKLHDFGSRGATSQESAMIAGAAHLVNFMGSDTVAGIWMANKYYDTPMSGYSIPASEHSTMSMWGKDNEVEAYNNMIEQYGKEPMFACVSDTWDIYNATSNLWGKELKAKIEKMNAMLIVRPDSGDPIEIISDLLCLLDHRFGSTINKKGYKVLNNVRLIQGDGNNPEIIHKTMETMEEMGWSITNIAFGMGGGLLQTNLDRDTCKFAFKCCAAVIDGKSVDVYKDPVTDSVKKSKRGPLDLRLTIGNEVYTTFGDKRGVGYSSHSLLETVFENGEILKEYTFDEVRANSNKKPFKQYIGWQDIYPDGNVTFTQIETKNNL